MTLSLALSPAASDDLHDAAAWFDARQPGPGDAFVRSVEACFARIQRLPQAFPSDDAGVRSALLRRFPYSVFFRIQEKRIEVLAVWHGRRDPRAWRQRIAP